MRPPAGVTAQAFLKAALGSSARADVFVCPKTATELGIRLAFDKDRIVDVAVQCIPAVQEETDPKDKVRTWILRLVGLQAIEEIR